MYERAINMVSACIIRKFQLNGKQYAVNALGELYDEFGNELNITTCGKNKDNYRCARLNYKKATAYVPRIVYYMFHYNVLPPELQSDKDIRKSTPFVRITHIDGDNSNNRIWNLKTYDSGIEDYSDSDSDSDINETKKQIKLNERMAKIAK